MISVHYMIDEIDIPTGLNVIGANLLRPANDSDNSRMYGPGRAQRNLTAFSTWLVTHHTALGLVGSHKICLHLHAARIRCGLHLCLLQ